MSRISEAIPAKTNWFAEKVANTRQFSRDVRLELKKVSWPTRDEVISTTVITLVAVFFFAFFLMVVDLGLTQGISYLTDLANRIFR